MSKIKEGLDIAFNADVKQVLLKTGITKYLPHVLCQV
jgi:hypothetical protein